jgi:hypothetical protein
MKKWILLQEQNAGLIFSKTYSNLKETYSDEINEFCSCPNEYYTKKEQNLLMCRIDENLSNTAEGNMNTRVRLDCCDVYLVAAEMKKVTLFCPKRRRGVFMAKLQNSPKIR